VSRKTFSSVANVQKMMVLFEKQIFVFCIERNGYDPKPQAVNTYFLREDKII